MQELCKCYIQNPDQFDQGNCQEFKELLLRLAVKYCDRYATDVLILIDSLRGSMNEDINMFLGFRQFGIDFTRGHGTLYRHHALIIKEGNLLTLHGELGEV
jgi:hypothetical protein